MPKYWYERKLRYEGAVLCPSCQSFLDHLKKTRTFHENMNCSYCGEPFEANDGQVFLHELNGDAPVRCPNCEKKEAFVCHDCGRAARMERWMLKRNEALGYRSRCQQCRKRRRLTGKGGKPHGYHGYQKETE